MNNQIMNTIYRAKYLLTVVIIFLTSCNTLANKEKLSKEEIDSIFEEMKQLGKKPNKDSAKKLGKYLKYKDKDVRLYAAHFMFEMQEDAIVVLAEMIEALDDENEWVSIFIMSAIGNLGASAEPAHEKLHALEKNSNPNISKAAKEYFRIFKICARENSNSGKNSLEVSTEHEKEILGNSMKAPIIYGRAECGNTTSQIASFKKRGIKAEFLNVDTNPKANKEIWFFAKKYLKLKNSLDLPLTISKGKVYTGFHLELVSDYK